MDPLKPTIVGSKYHSSLVCSTSKPSLNPAFIGAGAPFCPLYYNQIVLNTESDTPTTVEEAYYYDSHLTTGVIIRLIIISLLLVPPQSSFFSPS